MLLRIFLSQLLPHLTLPFRAYYEVSSLTRDGLEHWSFLLDRLYSPIPIVDDNSTRKVSRVVVPADLTSVPGKSSHPPKLTPFAPAWAPRRHYNAINYNNGNNGDNDNDNDIEVISSSSSEGTSSLFLSFSFAPHQLAFRPLLLAYSFRCRRDGTRDPVRCGDGSARRDGLYQPSGHARSSQEGQG